MKSYQQYPELASILDGADHVDVKVVEGDVTLREFLASMLGYQPGWITFLWHIRSVFVRFLGMRQNGVPRSLRLRPDQVPMKAGQSIAFFTVYAAAEDRYIVAETEDSHLRAALAVVREPLADNHNRFHVITIVHYHNWAGPVYFNVIRPFHHLVVWSMARAGIQGV